VRAGSQTAQGATDALFEDLEVGRALAGEGVLLHPGPQPLVRIESGHVSRKTVNAQAAVVSGQGRPSHFRPVGIETVPEQKDRARNPA
jgi:hypothetical protein